MSHQSRFINKIIRNSLPFNVVESSTPQKMIENSKKHKLNQNKFLSQLQKIQQVNDIITTSYKKKCQGLRSHRQTIVEQKLKIGSIDLTKKQQKKRKGPVRQKRKSSNNKDTIKDKTKSTIQLSRVKTNQNKKGISIDSLSKKTQKLQKNIKILWQCMGELWQNTKISQYMSQKNQCKIDAISKTLQSNQIQIIDIRSKNDIARQLIINKQWH